MRLDKLLLVLLLRVFRGIVLNNVVSNSFGIEHGLSCGECLGVNHHQGLFNVNIFYGAAKIDRIYVCQEFKLASIRTFFRLSICLKGFKDKLRPKVAATNAYNQSGLQRLP